MSHRFQIYYGRIEGKKVILALDVKESVAMVPVFDFGGEGLEVCCYLKSSTSLAGYETRGMVTWNERLET